MASVSDVTLAITAGSTANTSKATVTGMLHFDATDVGKGYRLEINLFGEDKLGDNLPATDPVGDDELYTFAWIAGMFSLKPYKQFVVASAGDQAFSESRTINNARLDEDSEQAIIGWADINTPILSLRKDEVYAKVVLAGVPVSARSATLDLGVGV